MFPYHPNMNNFGGLDIRLQNVSDKFFTQSLPQVPIQDVTSYDYPGNQLPWKGSVQGAYGQQLGGHGRGVGFTDIQLLQQQHQSLQSQQQLHEVHQQLVAPQLRQQLEHSRQHQMQHEPHLQFPETSYSALLHGPDTPPSQPEPAWDTPIQEMENHIAGGGMGWSLNGASSYQGFPNDFLMGKDQRSESQLGFYADPSLYVGGGGPGFAFHPGTQHILSEQPSCGLRLPLSIHQGTPMPQTFTSENALPKDQGYSNPFAGHKIQHSGQQLMEQNRVPNSLYEINSLHHSYDPGLSQQRSWGSSEQKWDAPNQSIPQASEGKEGSRQSIPNSEQLQMQQHLINIDMGNENAGFSHYQLGNILPEEGSFKQQEDWAMPSRGMPTGHHINDSERQQFNSWPSVQVQRMHPDFKNCLQLPADAKENTWGTNILQENCHFIENTFHVADTSASTQTGPSNLQSGWQAGPTDVSDSAATMAGSNFQPYQEGFYSSATLGARQGSGFGSVPESESPLSSSFERYGHYQGSWKNHTLLNQFIVGVDPRDPSFNGDGHSSIWNPDFQQGTVEAEAMNSVPRKPGNRHDTTSQQYHERLLSAGGHVRHQQNQTKYIQGHFVGEHAPDFVKAMEEQPVKSASNMSVDRETSSHEKDVELEGPRIKKQREFSEVDVGVYHLRRNQPSSPLSPQNVKLRLGPPSNGSQNLQQGGTISRGKSSQVQDMDNNFPSVGKDHNIQSFSDGGGSEIEMDQESGTSVDTHHWVLQRSGMPSNFSPSITKDSTQSKVPSSLASGQMVNGEDGQLVAPTHAMCSLENGARLSPRESNHGVHFLSGAGGRVQGNATNNGYSQGNFLTRFGAETLPLGNNPMKPIYDGNIREIMQDQLLVDLVMKQSGDIPQVANFPGLLTALKSSLSQQSMKSVGHQKTFPEEMDSSHSKFHGVQGDAPQVILETQINRRKPTNSGVVIGEGSTSVSRSSIGSQNFEEGDPNAQSKPPPEQSFCLDSSLQSKLQEQRRLSLFQLNGFRSSPLQDPGQRQDQNQFIYSKAVPPQTGAQLRGFSRSALEMFCPPLPIQRQSMQPQTEMGRPMNKSFEGRTHSEAWAPRIFESAVVAGGKSSETVLTTLNDQSNPGIMGKGALHHQEAADALAAMGQNGFLSESKAMQQQNSSSPDVGGQGKQQAADTLSFIHAQSPDQALRKDVVRSTNLMTMDAEARQSAGPYSGVMDNEQLLASQADTYYNPSAGGRDLALSQQLGWNQNQVVQYSGHHTPGVDYSALRDGQPTFSARTAGSILEQFSQHQFLFSKQKFHASIPIHPKKRKKPVPLLSPWHLAATQPRGQLPSISKAELMWANATNRLPEKDAGEIYNESASTAKRRLRITTQSMQQIIPPLPSVLMHGNKPVDNECVTYYFAKIALGEACRLMAGTEREAEPAQKGIDNKNLALHGQARMWGMAKDVAMTRLVERFMERVQHLDSELARLDCSTSALELKGKAHDLEKLSIVNRLAKHHGTGFFLDFSESIFVGNIPDCGPGIRRAAPQKYVIAVPMPRTLPEGIRCLSL